LCGQDCRVVLDLGKKLRDGSTEITVDIHSDTHHSRNHGDIKITVNKITVTHTVDKKHGDTHRLLRPLS
ncbi:MAG: hypothetical protein KDB23_23095, partial [Planctomycetales bacterium]|nr:hypothetical protein [Planctomycetales bacterium]